MKSHNSLRNNISILCLGALLITSGAVLIFIGPTILNNVLTLNPNSLLYELWREIPIDISADYYFFNWTNSEHVYNWSVKPKFEERGPYKFRQKEVKTDIVWNDNGTVTYKLRKFWFYEDTKDSGSLEDIIVSIDPITLGATHVSRTWNYYIRKGLFTTISLLFPSVTVSHTVRELLFDGYREPLIKVAAAIPLFSHLKLPQWDNFGWLYERNGTTDFDGVFNMGTGINSTLGEIYYYDYKKKTSYFEDECGQVYGSSGQFFPRDSEQGWMWLFSADLRRRLTLKFNGTETVNGIFGHKYIVEDYTLDNGTLYPENNCYCNGECVPSGLLNLSNTRDGLPMFASAPHFYGADPYYLNLVDGLESDPKKHEFSVVIEPTTGVPIDFKVRVQVNLLMQSIPGVPVFNGVPKVFVPVFWTAQNFRMKGLLAFLLMVLIHSSEICAIIGWTLIVIGIVVLLFYVFKRRDKDKQKNSGNEQIVPLRTNCDAKLFTSTLNFSEIVY